MTNSATPLATPSAVIPKALVVILLILSFLGFLDASFLTVKHYLGLRIGCSLFNINGCDVVTKSPYAAVGPIPIALLGALYYVFIFVLTILYWDLKKEKIILFIARFSIVGFVISLLLVFLQIFVIKAICLYCVGSAITSTLIFLLGLNVLKRLKKPELQIRQGDNAHP